MSCGENLSASVVAMQLRSPIPVTSGNYAAFRKNRRRDVTCKHTFQSAFAGQVVVRLGWEAIQGDDTREMHRKGCRITRGRDGLQGETCFKSFIT